MPLKPDNIVKISNFAEVNKAFKVDIVTKHTLDWFVSAALDSEVNLESQAEVLAFCRYLIISLVKTETFLNKLLKEDRDLLEVYNNLNS